MCIFFNMVPRLVFRKQSLSQAYDFVHIALEIGINPKLAGDSIDICTSSQIEFYFFMPQRAVARNFTVVVVIDSIENNENFSYN